jgi:hypothetical protein
MSILRRPSSLSDRRLARQGKVPRHGLGEHRVPLVHLRQHEVKSTKKAFTVETAALFRFGQRLAIHFRTKHWLICTQTKQSPHRDRRLETPQIRQAARPHQGPATETHGDEGGSTEGRRDGRNLPRRSARRVCSRRQQACGPQGPSFQGVTGRENERKTRWTCFCANLASKELGA